MGLNMHKKSCSCGDSVRESCVGHSFIGGTSSCVLCGQQLNSFPELLAIGKEDEEYQE